MRPRNLREPTNRRCRYWWDDFVAMWSAILRVNFNDRD
jgi:hypothetical protein